MSLSIHVALYRDRMPHPSQWKAAILSSDFEVALDDDFDIDDFVGFLPTMLGEIESGFEYFSYAVDDEVRDDFRIITDHDFVVEFVYT